MSQRDEFVRQLWLAGFSFHEDLQTAHVYVHPSGERVLVPKRESWAPAPSSNNADAANISPCCSAPSRFYVVHDGVMYFRCTVCRQFWDRAAAIRPRLTLVK